MSRIKTTAGRNSYHWDYQELRYLVHVLMQAKDFRETLNLLLDLHTKKEIAELIRRLLITSMVQEGMTYEQIRGATGAAPNTISFLAGRFLRQKSVVGTMLGRAGTFEDFRMKTAKKDSSLARHIDQLLKEIRRKPLSG